MGECGEGGGEGRGGVTELQSGRVGTTGYEWELYSSLSPACDLIFSRQVQSGSGLRRDRRRARSLSCPIDLTATVSPIWWVAREAAMMTPHTTNRDHSAITPIQSLDIQLTPSSLNRLVILTHFTLDLLTAASPHPLPPTPHHLRMSASESLLSMGFTQAQITRATKAKPSADIAGLIDWISANGELAEGEGDGEGEGEGDEPGGPGGAAEAKVSQSEG